MKHGYLSLMGVAFTLMLGACNQKTMEKTTGSAVPKGKPAQHSNIEEQAAQKDSSREAEPKTEKPKVPPHSAPAPFPAGHEAGK